MNRTYLIVFLGQIINKKIVDISEDPCFDCPPSWGICRPPTRRAVKCGDTLIFIAKIGKDYFLKGWFQVGDKLDYASALQAFSSRQNVIITTTPSIHQIKWRYKSLKKNYIKAHGQSTLNFCLILIQPTGYFIKIYVITTKLTTGNVDESFIVRLNSLINVSLQILV